MKVFHSLLWLSALAAVFTAGSIYLGAQTVIPAHKSNFMAVTIAMEKKQVHIGESPKVIITIENVSDHTLMVNGCPGNRFYVQGEKGEPPTTLIQRSEMNRLLPGEAAIECTVAVATPINPGGIFKGSAQLSYFYDLSSPGRYTVYAEIPSPEGLLRTDSMEFEILAASPTQQKDSH